MHLLVCQSNCTNVNLMLMQMAELTTQGKFSWKQLEEESKICVVGVDEYVDPNIDRVLETAPDAHM